MTARFMKGTPYAALKIEMQRPPGFRPRKSGMIISRCVCGTQECDCSLCAHKERNGIDQMAKRCACLCEQILAGCTPLSKLRGDLTAEVLYAALYLLSADRFLWGKSVPAVKPDAVHFKEIQIHGVNLGGYVLFHTAKDLYQGTQHISLSELTDPELVGDEIFRLIIHALLIRRYGLEAISAERRNR